MITVYHLATSRSERVLWLLEELGVPYEVERFQRDPATQRAPEAYRKIHPLGKAPTLRDGETLLIESGAIVQYLVDRHGAGKLAPAPDDPAYPRYLQWLHFAEGSAMSLLVLDLFLSGGVGGEPSSLAPRFREEALRTLRFIDDELGGRPWFAGNVFTAGDVMMAFPLRFAAGRGLTEGLRHIAAYLERVNARPAYRKAMEIAAA